MTEEMLRRLPRPWYSSGKSIRSGRLAPPGSDIGGGTALDLLEVQLAGRSVVSGREFVSGARILPGTALQPE